jgi:hypothetical protein
MRTRRFWVVAASSVLVSVSLTAVSASAATSPDIDPTFAHIRQLATKAIETSKASEEARVLVVAATPPPPATLYGIPLRGDAAPSNVSVGGVPLRGDTPLPTSGFSASGIPLRGDISSSPVSDATSPLSLTVSEDLAPEVSTPATTLPTELPFQNIEFSADGLPLRGVTNPTVNGVPLRGNLFDQASNAPLTGLALLEAQYASIRDTERVALSELATAVNVVTEAGFTTSEVVASWMDSSFPRRLAVFTALEYFGAPYLAAAAGPDAFDCSGLTLTAWRAAGVDLEHWSVLQQTSVSPVPYELTIAGDLAFFEGGPTAGGVWNIGHVSMVFAPGFLVQSSPSNGVWVSAFTSQREATSFGSPAVEATI